MNKIMKEFIKDRNEAFASMDEEKIRAYCNKYDIQMPNDEKLFWIGVNKAVCNLYLSPDSMITLEQYNRSYEWLREHDATPVINLKSKRS